MTISISARVLSREPPYQPETQSRNDIQDDVEMSCINLFIIYFRQLFHESKKKTKKTKKKHTKQKTNDFLWKFNCPFNRYIVRTLLSNKSISTPININGNTSYEGTLKHRKFRRCDSFVSFFLLLIMMRTLPVNRFYDLFKVVFLTIFSPIKLICQ